MRKSIAIVVSLLSALIFITGCSNSMSNQELLKLDPKAEKAMLFIYRPHNDFWRKKRYSIYINGNYEQTLVNRFYFKIQKDAGKYKVELREDVEYKPEVFTLDMNLKEGKIYYLRFGTESIESHPDFKEVPRSRMHSEEHLIRKGF